MQRVCVVGHEQRARSAMHPTFCDWRQSRHAWISESEVTGRK
jgi:hypothetical protein